MTISADELFPVIISLVVQANPDNFLDNIE